MIKVSVMYPNTTGARFDHDYYRTRHMALLRELVGSSCKSVAVDKGLSGGGKAPAPYAAMCHLEFDSIEAFQAGFGPHAKALMADTPNYTDIAPVMQISEVVDV
jgi:uncharacterized protein (TIGR02118 family)